MTVRQLLRTIDSRELTEWQALAVLRNKRMKEAEEEAKREREKQERLERVRGGLKGARPRPRPRRH